MTPGHSSPDVEQVFAERVAAFSQETLDDSVLNRAGLVACDTIGAILGGISDPAVEGLCSEFGTDDGPVLIPGTDRYASVEHAAMITATAGTVLELDEGHQYAGGHPAIHVLPAILAEIQAESYDRDTIRSAFVIGYEVASRVGQACGSLEHGYHPHGVWGGVGAAAAIGRLRGYDAETIESAMSIAANSAQHTRFAAATEGATVRNTYAGMSALTGYVAARQAAAGVTGIKDGISRHLSSATSSGFNSDLLLVGRGDVWEIERGYFKTHPACRFTHAAIDAAAALTARGAVTLDSIERVTIETYEAAAALDETNPQSALAARFSLPFTVAVQFVDGSVEAKSAQFEQVPTEIERLIDRIDLAATAEFERATPDARGARLTVEHSDGSVVSETIREARGGGDDPFTRAELRSKFADLATPVIGSRNTDRAWIAVADTFDLTNAYKYISRH